MEQSQSDVERAYAALHAKQAPYSSLFNYYLGAQPLQYTVQQLSKVFKNLTAKWTENWCAVVIDSLLDRLTLTGFAAEDTKVKTALEELWNGQDLALDADRVHKSVLVTGEAFVLVERVDDGDDPAVRVFFNGAHLCHVFYEEDNPKEVEFACKWWEHEGATHLTLYYEDRFEHYVAHQKRARIENAAAFSPDPEGDQEPNPWGIIPVFHFAPDPAQIQSELINVVPLQNAVNKLFADMMVSAEFGAFKQRYVVSNADTAKLKNGPNELWEIPAGDKETDEPTQVGSFEATELKNFIEAMDNIANKIAIVTRTPKHYLLQAGDISGEALLAMEAPLVKKASKYAARMEVCWRNAMTFALGLQGITAERADINVTWEEERTVQPLTQAQTRKTNVEAGMPLVTILRDEGWTEAQLEQMQDDRDGEDSAKTDLSDVVVQAARKTFDSGGGVVPSSPLPPEPGASPPSSRTAAVVAAG